MNDELITLPFSQLLALVESSLRLSRAAGAIKDLGKHDAKVLAAISGCIAAKQNLDDELLEKVDAELIRRGVLEPD